MKTDQVENSPGNFFVVGFNQKLNHARDEDFLDYFWGFISRRKRDDLVDGISRLFMVPAEIGAAGYSQLSINIVRGKRTAFFLRRFFKNDTSLIPANILGTSSENCKRRKLFVK